MGLNRRDVDQALADAAVEAGRGREGDTLKEAAGIDPAALLCGAQPVLVPFLRSLAERVKADSNFLVRWIGGGLLDTLVELVASVCEEET